MKERVGDTPHVLTVRLGHLGDVLLTTGVLRYFGQKQGLRFDVLTRQEWASVFTGHPWVNSVISVTPDDLSTKAFLSFCRTLAAQYGPEDLLLDLHGTMRSTVLRAYWPGHYRCYPKMSFTRRVFALSKGRFGRKPLHALSVLQRYALALENAVIPEEALLPELFLTNDERRDARGVVNSLFGPGARPVALHPFAAHATKTWTAAQWRALGSSLDAAGIPWVAVGKGTCCWDGAKHSLINQLTLRQSAAVLAECRALVTGDSGPMHLARSVHTPVVALFGPTTREWGFYPTEAEGVVLERSLACRPCSLHGTGECAYNGECLRDIMPHDVHVALATIANRVSLEADNC